MVHYFINLENTESPEEQKDGHGKPSIKSEIMFQLMMAVGVNRLFNRRTIKEFLFRIAISLHRFGIIRNFFSNDLIFEVDYGDKKIELYLNDIINHVGLEINDDEYHLTPRGLWMKNIDHFWRNAATGAVISGVPVIATEKVGERTYNVGVNEPGKPSEDTIKLAKLFAGSAIKIIGDKRIRQVAKRVEEYNKLLNDYRDFMESVVSEEYAHESVPLEIRNEFYRHIIGPIDAESPEYQEIINDKNSVLARLIHLAWLYVNGHVIEYEIVRTDGKKGRNAEVERVYERVGGFDYDDYEGLNNLGFGINISDTYYDFGLDKLAYMLKEKVTEDLN